jgi:sulfate permease, SulP family
VIPGWIQHYRGAWLRPDVIACVVIWSVVVPQAVAYAQIAGLPPEAGLMAAPGAMAAYALLGTSRTLVVSATTATSAVSASAVGPLAHGDATRFAALSAALAFVAGVVLIAAGALKLGALSDFVSKPVMTGFLFGLGLTIMVGQAPSLLGVEGSSGKFFHRLKDLINDLGDVQLATLAVGAGSIAVLVLGRKRWPGFPATLLVLIVATAVSAIFNLSEHGVDVVGHIPSAGPEVSIPDIQAGDIAGLIGAGFGILIMTTEAVGVARALATQDGYHVNPNRDLMAFGVSNLAAGFSSGFVQSGGASQTAAAQRAGGNSQMASFLAAVLILLTGLFLSDLFRDLPQATLAAIVIVAVASFLNVADLRRFAGIRTSAIVFASIALAGVLVLGVLAGLILAAVLSLVYLIRRFSRPSVGVLGRDPAAGEWGRLDRHPDWETLPNVLVAGSDGPLLYSNAVYVRERILGLVHAADPPPEVVVVDLGTNTDLDVETLDDLGDLATSRRQRASSCASAPSARARESCCAAPASPSASAPSRRSMRRWNAPASPRPGDARSPLWGGDCIRS